MRDDDGPDGAGGEHGAPGRGRVTHLPLSQPDRVLEILQLLVRDLPVLVRRVLHHDPPQQAPEQRQEPCDQINKIE